MSVPAHHTHPLRVYWEDTDGGGVVFFANYLKFFERARTEWMRTLGYGQEAMRRDVGIVFVVAETNVRYLRSARLDDWLNVTVSLQEIGGSRLIITQEAWRDDELLATSRIAIVCVDAHTLKPTRLPDVLRAVLPPPIGEAAALASVSAVGATPAAVSAASLPAVPRA